MINPNFGWRKAGIASVATTLVLGASLAGVGAASADATFAFTRIAGIDRYDTAARAADAFDPAANDVILANGVPGSYADALSANYLAGVRNDPILLTRLNVTPQFTLDQLQDSGVENITIVGGFGVVSAAQESALETAGYTVDRIAGIDRYKTNADIIAEGGASDPIGVIATGLNFPDALGGGPVAFDGHALGLSRANDIDDDVVAALDAAGVTSVLVLGGPTIVGPAVLTELAAAGITLEERIFGADRSGTSTDLADYAIANLGFVNTQVNVASGYGNGSGADALAGGPLTGKQLRPMLVTRDVNNVGDLDDWLTAHASTLTGTTNIIFGGTGAVSTAAENTMEAAARTEAATNQSFTVSPTTTQIRASDEVSQYTFSGLDPAKKYDIKLFPCGTSDGPAIFSNGEPIIDRAGATLSNTISFLDKQGGTGGQPNDLPDESGSTQNSYADITLVNLTTQSGQFPGDSGNAISPKANGTMDVVMAVNSANQSDCAIPVVWEEATSGTTDNGEVDLKDSNEDTAENDDTAIAAEKFAVGPASVWHNGHALNGASPSFEDVIFVGAANLFGTALPSDTLGVVLSDGSLYGVSSTDSFFYDGSEVEGAISQTNGINWLNIGDYEWDTCDGDDECGYVIAPYTRTGTNNWLNDGQDVSNTAPTNPVGTAGNLDGGTTNDDVRMTWTAPSWGGAPSADVDEYCWELWNVNNLDAGSVQSGCTDEQDSLNLTGDAPTTTAQDAGTADDVDANNLAAGVYRFRVDADSETDDDSDYSQWSPAITVLGGVDVTAPTMTDAWVSTDNAPGGVLISAAGTSTDVIDFAFSEDMANTLGGSVTTSLTLTDGSDSFVIDCAPVGSCTLDANETQLGANTNGTVDDHLRIDLNLATITRDGGALAMAIPSTVTSVSNAWDDQAGNQLNLAGSADKIVDNE